MLYLVVLNDGKEDNMNPEPKKLLSPKGTKICYVLELVETKSEAVFFPYTDPVTKETTIDYDAIRFVESFFETSKPHEPMIVCDEFGDEYNISECTWA